MTLDEAKIEASARRLILACVYRDTDAARNIIAESCSGCLALTLGELAAGLLTARLGAEEARRFATDDAARWLDAITGDDIADRPW